jgi:hypothetical protein
MMDDYLFIANIISLIINILIIIDEMLIMTIVH